MSLKTKRTIAESAIIDMPNGRWRPRSVAATAHLRSTVDELWHIAGAFGKKSGYLVY
jgi:hypothetical protein